MRWRKPKLVEPLTVEQVMADKPDMSPETAQAVVDFVALVGRNAEARKAERRALPWRQRLWAETTEFRGIVGVLFAGYLLVVGWVATLDFRPFNADGWVGYAFRGAWILIGLIGLSVKMNKAEDD